MKVMRILAKVFAIVGLVVDIGLFLYGLIAFIAACVAAGSFAGAALFILAIVYLLISIVGIIVGIKIISSLDSNDKQTYLGILGIIFLSLLGGIFYLIWNPGVKVHSEGDVYAGIFGNDYKERKFDSFDKVEILDNCTSVDPKITKGQTAYVIDSGSLDLPVENRWTKVLFIHKDNSSVIHDFHNFVFRKVGQLSDDFPGASAKVEPNEVMKMNHDFKGLNVGDEVKVIKFIPHGRFKVLDKCKVERSFTRPNSNKVKKIRRVLYSFYLSE